MKVLAIIPAAEGLKTLPNRNMRIVNGKPLIYYAVNNAKKSNYVTDIVVTSNSDEVLTIVEQIGGAICYRRSENLSGIEVPLERVIDDVRNILPFENYDYVVTMQSISPTLKASTLDLAIRECIENDIDTMISVVPKKNYFWSLDHGKVFCYQKKRVRKSQLEPFYMETGAFFISKPEYMNAESRIGGEVKLFELPKEEGVDVLSFGDLKEAEYYLSRKKVAFFVNGNSEIGMGHIRRTLLLADEFFTKPSIFFDRNKTELDFFGDTSYEIESVDGENGLIRKLREGSYDVLINDILQTDEEYMRRIKADIPSIKIINFEDDGSGAKYADTVINCVYEEADESNWLVGAEYYIAPKLFMLQDAIEVKDKVKNVLISFGGADPMDYTSMLLSLVTQEEYKDYHFHVILGPAYNKKEQIHQNYQNENITFYSNVNNMVEIMKKCDLAITSRGRTGFELAICGIPTICIAQNDREERHTFLSEKNGFEYLGFSPEVKRVEVALDKLLHSSKEYRSNIQNKMQKHDLKKGRKNVIDLIREI